MIRTIDKPMAIHKFRRMAAAFEEEVARARFSQSSGSEHSPEEGSMNLSDLVDTFMETEEPERTSNVVDLTEDESDSRDSDLWIKEELTKLLGFSDDETKENIRAEVEKIHRDSSSVDKDEEKRGWMVKLRNRGFDAGLCKSKWEKTGKYPSGSYEFVDIKRSENHPRYIIEINFVNEFAIARPTTSYISLMKLFPSIFVGTTEDLKRIVRLMCRGMKESLKSADISMPPWRSHGYLHSKWFGPFKRTTNEFPTRSESGLVKTESKKRWVGFEPGNIVFSKDCNCKRNLGGGRIGLLALALNS